MSIFVLCVLMCACFLLARRESPPQPFPAPLAALKQPIASPRSVVPPVQFGLAQAGPETSEAVPFVAQPKPSTESASQSSDAPFIADRDEKPAQPIPESPSVADTESLRPCAPKVVETLEGRVVSIADGDTLTILTSDKRRVIIRLEGIDAPERGQEHGTKAKEALADVVFNKAVTIKATGTDRYQRTLGFVLLHGLDVNEQLVSDGWAWHFTKYNCEERFDKAEKRARAAKKGLWAHESPIPPWEFRAIKAATPVKIASPRSPPTKSVESLPVVTPANPSVTKSEARDYWLNTAKDSNVRHNSGCRWFGKTKQGRYCTKSEGRACGICGG